MQAIILAGGKGARLRPYSQVLPKPLMPIGDMPILEVIVRQLAAAGFDDLVVSAGYLADLLRAFVGDGERFGVPIRFVTETEPLGTAGALALVPDLADEFLVINGDTLTTLDYAALVQAHRDGGALATVAMHEREEQVDFGVLETDAQGALVSYSEKPVHRYRVSMGVTVFRAEAVRQLARGQRKDMPDLLLDIVAAGGRVQCVDLGCYWLDIGRLPDYERAVEVFEQRRHEFLPRAP